MTTVLSAATAAARQNNADALAN